MRRLKLRAAVLLALAPFALAACNESGVVTVHRLSFQGVHAVDQDLLSRRSRRARAAKCRSSDGNSLGQKHGFDQTPLTSTCSASGVLRRPRLRTNVTKVDVVPTRKSAVDVTVTIDEESQSTWQRSFLRLRRHTGNISPRFSAATPFESDSRVTARQSWRLTELALSELRDHGYRYAAVGSERGPEAWSVGSVGKVCHRDVYGRGHPRHFGAVGSRATTASAIMIERELSAHPEICISGEVRAASSMQ